MQDSAIDVEGLIKHFGDVKAIDGVDLQVQHQTVFGLLGPNGAGKTTTVRILTTLLAPDAGRATVAGYDVVKDAEKLRHVIGLAGQSAAVDENLTGLENLEMVGRLYHLSAAEARRRSEVVLERFELTDAAHRTAKTYSGGMRRRLDLAGALVARPPVLFLDEPTTGLDPRARIDMWGVLQQLVAGGTTLLLTTQYLEEADLLADEIVVIDHGRVIATGTADDLKDQVGGERLELTVDDPARLEDAQRLVEPLGQAAASIDKERKSLTVAVSGGAAVLAEALRRLDGEHIELADVGLHRPTLDDVFLTLTGHVAEETTEASPVPAAGEVRK
jgi:ABC-2 type transport system ATP-binding protein